MAELIKYKHYLIVTAALIFALYITEPLMLMYDELKQTNELNQKREVKLTELLAQQQTLAEQLELAESNASKVKPYLFNKASESEFQLAAQTLVEKTFSASDCSIDRVAWQGKIVINEHINQWRLNIRFKGESLCVVNVTKQLETLAPLLRFAEYNYTSRDWAGNPQQSLTGDIDLIMWNNQQVIQTETPEEPSV